jgi:hypothetical protein
VCVFIYTFAAGVWVKGCWTWPQQFHGLLSHIICSFVTNMCIILMKGNCIINNIMRLVGPYYGLVQTLGVGEGEIYSLVFCSFVCLCVCVCLRVCVCVGGRGDNHWNSFTSITKYFVAVVRDYSLVSTAVLTAYFCHKFVLYMCIYIYKIYIFFIYTHTHTYMYMHTYIHTHLQNWKIHIWEIYTWYSGYMCRKSDF